MAKSSSFNPLQEVREHLTLYRLDHERHITDLSTEIRHLGATPGNFHDFKGYFIKGFTSLRSETGTKGATHAMHTNEKLTNKEYEAAKYWDLPPELKQIIALGREDERRHLVYRKGIGGKASLRGCRKKEYHHENNKTND